uniref:Ribosomal protein L16 n=1 Tax=Ophirina amphinema TaxID=2108040 RepID=A0A348AYR3_9EUKA|nr:ribosomal protein L16 [Ophirina amphinema]
MLIPKRTKFRKYQKGRVKGIECTSNKLKFGIYGIKALEGGRITASQIESVRLAVVRKVRKSGRLWIRIFPDISVTSKPVEVRMGRGKGSIDYWCTRVRPGKVLFELDGVTFDIAKEVLSSACFKLPIKAKFFCESYVSNI